MYPDCPAVYGDTLAPRKNPDQFGIYLAVYSRRNHAANLKLGRKTFASWAIESQESFR